MLYMKNGELCHMDDELYHYKYISRERKNGRWQYKYADSKNTKATKSSTTAHQKNRNTHSYIDDAGVQYIKSGGDKYGTYTAKGKDWTTNIVKTNKLFSSTQTIEFYSIGGKANSTKRTTVKVGLIAQAIDKGKKWLSNLFKKKR